MTDSAGDIARSIEALSHSDPEVRLSAASALQQWLGDLLDAQTDATGFERLLSHAYPDLLPALVSALGDPHKGVQVTAANSLQFLAYQSAAVIPLLRGAMAGAPWRAWGAAIVCARMNLWFPEMEGALAGALGSPNRDVRWAAANLLVQLGRRHGEAVAAAQGALAGDKPTARKMGAYCLGAMGEYTAVADSLAGALADGERDVRRAAILALDKLPRLSPQTLDRIAALREDPDVYVRRSADAVARKKGRP